MYTLAKCRILIVHFDDSSLDVAMPKHSTVGIAQRASLTDLEVKDSSRRKFMYSDSFRCNLYPKQQSGVSHARRERK